MIQKSLLAAAVIALLSAPAAAQDFGAAFSGFSTGSDEPIQIEADQLEVRDPDKVAIYTGNVRVRQGATVLETPELRVHYTGEAQGETPRLGGGADRGRSRRHRPYAQTRRRPATGPCSRCRAIW